jgi:predicted metal-dependent hydrolase
MTTLDEKRAAELFAQGVEQFNRGQFFESHESWEEVWLAAPEPDKTFLQGIIQVAAAFHHCQRGNRNGARSLLKEGLRKLERFPPDYRKLNLQVLRAAARAWVAALEGDGETSGLELPHIELSTGLPR